MLVRHCFCERRKEEKCEWLTGKGKAIVLQGKKDRKMVLKMLEKAIEKQ